MEYFETIKLYRDDLYKYKEGMRLRQEARGDTHAPADLKKLGDKYTF